MSQRYEWRETPHGPQLWDLEHQCWVLWYGIGAIGITNDVKAEIITAINELKLTIPNTQAVESFLEGLDSLCMDSADDRRAAATALVAWLKDQNRRDTP